ncbi:MAG: N-glycosylase/DNA lyase [Blastocatellia bacterium]|nr:N-glycosylase/DNA lyase [Blastocatellia bacterium]
MFDAGSTIKISMLKRKRTTKEPVTIESLIEGHKQRRAAIAERLAEFREVGETGDDVKLFEELVFCIFTAGASARMGMKCIEFVRPVLLTGSQEEIYQAIEGKHMYPKDRARYIYLTREYLKEEFGLKMRQKLDSFEDPQQRRDYWAANPKVKGIGYKEGSHFLRNIGYKGYAILDKHVLRSLCELGVLGEVKPPTNKKRYLEIESQMKQFSDEIGIDFDELDLVLWSAKTGEILK